MKRNWMLALGLLLAGAAAACTGTDGGAQAAPAEGAAAEPATESAAGAAQAGDPVMDAVRHVVETRAGNLTQAAESMPAEKYGFSPTKEQMTFGHLVGHVAGSNAFLCSKLSGTPAPDATKAADDAGKDALVAAIKASFDYCGTALQGVNDAQLADSVDFFGGRRVTKATAAIELASDLADHYAAAANYLRLNGILPPTARRGM